MDKDLPEKVKKQLDEIDFLLIDTLTHDIIPDRTYTQIVTKLGNIETNYMSDKFKAINQDYYTWVKIRLEKISSLLVSLKKHSSTSFSIPNEDLMHVTGDYYNEDNSITLTDEIKAAINNILHDKYSA